MRVCFTAFVLCAAGLIASAQDNPTVETAEDAIAWLADAGVDHEADTETLGLARELIGASAKAEPGLARWEFGLGLVDARSGNWGSAKDRFGRCVELDGGTAEYHHWLGNATFSTIDQVGLLGKASAARKGRDAYLRALELDPGIGGARVGLCEYYLNAPGIAGGSRKKAREQAERLLDIAGFECHGHRVLATIHAKEGEWTEGAERIDRAIETAEPGEERRSMYMAWIGLTLQKDRHADAVTYARRLLDAQPNDPRNAYTLGAVLQESGRHAEAVAHLEAARDAMPDQASPLWRLAQSYDELGRHREAHAAYTRFVERFGDDGRVKAAKKRVKRLARKIP